MSRRALTLAVFVGIAVAVCTPACKEEPHKRTNILFITIDTLRADHLGTYAYARGTSPAIDAWGKQAVVFDAASSSASWTLPSVASLMTSLYSTTHGCWKVQSKLDPEYQTLAESLRENGYDTAMVACHLFMSAQYGLQQGFTHVDDTLIRTGADSDLAISSPGVTERGLAFLEAKSKVQDDVPWMLWLHYFDPHDQYLVHEGFSERFGTEREIDRYDGEIAFTDHYVGQVLQKLEQLGFAEDTLVILTADHGEEFGEHGHMRHGHSLYEPAVRIPLMIRAPGFAARRVPDVVSGVDLLPTVLELAGVELGARQIEGASLVGLMQGKPEAPRRALSEVRWHEDSGQDMRSMRTENWKYIEHRLGADSRDFVFDLARDPGEMHDLAKAQLADLERLREQLGRRLVRAMEWAKGYPIPKRYEPSPGDLSSLVKLGYTEGDEVTEEKK